MQLLSLSLSLLLLSNGGVERMAEERSCFSRHGVDGNSFVTGKARRSVFHTGSSLGVLLRVPTCKTPTAIFSPYGVPGFPAYGLGGIIFSVYLL
jgi:hypothetical protein